MPDPKRNVSRKPRPAAALRRQTLKASEARYSSLVDHLPVGVYRTNPEGRILTANPALVKMLGYQSEEELRGVNVNDLYIRKKDREAHLHSLDQRLIYFTELKLRRRDGGTIWGNDFPRAVPGPTGAVRYYDGILVNITRRKKIENQLRRTLAKLAASNRERQEMIHKLEALSVTDDLTGLYNRRGFNLMARQTMKIGDRRKVLMFLLFLDMDNLKGINDSLGHSSGDEALRRMADILKITFRKSDVKGRMGGDEFAVFPVDTSFEGVRSALARLEGKVLAFNQSDRAPFQLAFSAGVACYDPTDPITIEELLARADKLMYAQKELKGRKR